MSELTPSQLTLLLATCIKQFGEANTLVLVDQELKAPIQVSLHPGVDGATIMLLEGQDQLDRYDVAKKKLEDKNIAISERDREPNREAE